MLQTRSERSGGGPIGGGDGSLDSGLRGALELVRLPRGMPESGHGCTTLYPCLPEFCNERTRSGSAVRYLSTPSERSQHLLSCTSSILTFETSWLRFAPWILAGACLLAQCLGRLVKH